MGVFNCSGESLSAVFNYSGESLSQAYDIDGSELIDQEEHDWDQMDAQFKASIDACIDYCSDYVSDHSDSFAFPVFNDVHDYLAWNEPHYISYASGNLFPVYLFLGDIANAYSNTQLENAVIYMNKVRGPKLVAIGNHEFGGYSEGYSLPRNWYKPLIPATAVVYSDDGLTYYFDDEVNNVRYFVMDSVSTVKRANGTQSLSRTTVDWLASVLESTDKDVIILNHAMGSGFYLVTDTEKTDWKSDTTVHNMTVFNQTVNAFINKTSCAFTDDDGVSHSHDFSDAGGNFIAYITGHYHQAGYYDAGYNKFTCQAITRSKNRNGMDFFVIDKSNRKIEFLNIRYDTPGYQKYEYSY